MGLAIYSGGLFANLRHEIQALLAHEFGQIIGLVVQHRFQPLDVPNSHGNNMPLLVEHCAQSVHQLGALMDNALSRPK